MRKRKFTIARRLVQTTVFLLFFTPFAYLAIADSEKIAADSPFFGSLSSSIVFRAIHLTDPFAFLQTLVASKSLSNPALLIGPALILGFYTLVKARAFCGWVCPVGALCELSNWLANKIGLRFNIEELTNRLNSSPFPRRLKIYVALGVLLLSALTSIPLFELFNPIGALSKALVFGMTVGLWTLAAILLHEFFFGGKIWCRSLCPVGGLYHVFGKVSPIKIKIDQSKCIHCDKCRNACLANPEILDDVIQDKEKYVQSGDCSLCGRCIEACPSTALSLGLNLLKTKSNLSAKK